MALNITPGVKSDLSPREWLSQQTDDEGNALAKFPSRGQFSAKAKDALAQAAAAGMTFSEPAKATPTPRAAVPAKSAAQRKAEKRAALLAQLEALGEDESEPVVAEVAETVESAPEGDVLLDMGTLTYSDEPKPERVSVPLPVLYASEDGEPTNSPVGFDHCFRPGCFQTVEACKCKQGPKAPANLLTIG